MAYPASELVIDPVLIRKYDVSGPRYTSYPTADRFVEAFGEADCRHWLGKRNIGGINQPLSIYVHLPFCDVQKAVHRIQSEAETRRVIDEARACGFRSVNLDLIYGLPKQSLDSFSKTLDRVLEIAPERIALYSYAHLPRAFKPQRRISEADLPSAEAKLQILTLAIGRLTRAGYLYIGMDHFAKPDDELALAQSQGRLQRNFQGYSTHPESDMLGFGISAIGRVGPTYFQNLKTLEEYYDALDAGRQPVWRGLELTQDDLVRRAVIQALICNFRLSVESIEISYLIDFRRYFAEELEDLKRLADDGLVELQPDWIVVTPRGRLIVRAVCMTFDRYLRASLQRAGYSRVI
ncbi:MAG: oxygen-independent coproporphyrinogen III oxidase [Betaproteobacteria bacterium]|nr:oxygen-independent coproporphyrinogen III oxidase [Betaproteobacteria bacterium]